MFLMNENIRLYDDRGNRLYLTGEERAAFLDAARKAPRQVRTFCAVLHFTGCRLSEVLALTSRRIGMTETALSVSIPSKNAVKGSTELFRFHLRFFWIPWTWFTASVRRRSALTAPIWTSPCGPGRGRRPGGGYRRSWMQRRFRTARTNAPNIQNGKPVVENRPCHFFRKVLFVA